MKTRAAILVCLCLCVPALGQKVFWQENFNMGLPSGWNNIYMGFAEPWYWVPAGATNGSADVYYEWFCNNGFSYRNTILRSPPIDLSGLTNATFQCQQNQLMPLSRVYNAVKVTTNNGATYTLLYQETGSWSGTGTIQVSLNAWAGQPNVRLAFHYQGAIANEWRIDDVRVLTSSPILTLTGLTANQVATLTVNGASPGNPVIIAYSLNGAGPMPTPWGNANLTAPVGILATLTANAAGQVSVMVPVPAGTTGFVVYLHAAEVNPNGSLDFTNSMTRTVG